MYQNTSKEFNSIIEGDGRTFYARMVYGDEILNRFISIKLTSQANEDTNTISIGGAVSSFIEVSMEKPDTLLTGKEYSFEIGLMVGEAMEWVPMGIFTPQKPKESDGIVTFTAYDRMVSKLSGAYFTDITGYPTDGKVILQEIATKTGIPLGNLDDLPGGVMVPMRTQTGEEGTTTAKPFDGYTYREAVKYLAQMYGKFATFNRDGELEFRWYTESGFNTNRLYAEPESAESVYTLQKIICTVGENTLTSGSGITGISIENPVMTQEILNNVFTQIGGMEYLPTTCSFFGDIRLDLGDIITVQGRTGTERKVPVMSLSVDFDGGIITDIGSYGNTEGEESQIKGPTATALDRVYTDLFLVREVLANKVSTDTLEANYATIKQLNAVSARIDKITSTEITTEYLEANYADIKLANIETSNVATLFAKVGLIDRATIVEGHITGFLDSVEVNANNITAGTLVADRILIRGAEQGLLYALNNFGELTSESIDTLDGHVLTDRTVNADKIVAGSITANEIDVENLFAQNIVATGSITGVKLYGTYIETTGGKIGGFNIGKVGLDGGTISLYSGDSLNGGNLTIGGSEFTGCEITYAGTGVLITKDEKNIGAFRLQNFDSRGIISQLDADEICENGIPLSDSYLSLSGGDLTGNLKIDANLYVGALRASTYDTGAYLSKSGFLRLSRAASSGNPSVALYYDNAETATSSWEAVSENCANFKNYTNFGYATAQSTHRIKANGSIYANGNIYEEGTKLSSKYNPLMELTGHTSFDSKSVPSGTVTSLGSVTLTAGKWLVISYATFKENATGFRRIIFGTSNSVYRNNTTTCQAANGASTILQNVRVFSISSSTTYYLYAHQNSGSSLDVSGGYTLIKIA